MQPTERILALAAYAHDRTRFTLDDVADDVPGYETDALRDADGRLVAEGDGWEAVRKKLQRDVKDLREHWGIDVAFDASAQCYSLSPPFLTPAERRALVAAAATVAVEGVEPETAGALGSAVDDRGAQIVIRVHELVRVLRDAARTRTPVTFGYEGTPRHVQPYGLGVWRNRWYLAGHDTDRDARRRFRLDRIVDRGAADATIRPDGPAGAYDVPADFDADTAFDLDPNTWGTDPVLRARVAVGRDHVAAFCAEFANATVVTTPPSDQVASNRSAVPTSATQVRGGAGEGRAIVELDVREHTSFRTRLLAFRTDATLLEPPELVALVHDHLAALAGVR